ncbi:glycosyltransferase family 2 protein [Lactiplantibacillus plantarum]|uniref:glycosyltransferase family 2 protein n=1 Tax=Lactiplantibacillus plantarum TaxID=1590 RepID=UPI0009349C89|nr:glycosyltransferase family A protein [Lactiplantibacillus plantarum]
MVKNGVNERPIISIIIPTANNETTIKRAISSIRLENVTFEVLVVINNSSDQTREIVELYQNAHQYIRILDSPGGRSRARNDGLKAALGKYIYFLDSDDEANPSFIQSGVALLECNQNLDCVAVASNTEVIHDQSQATDKFEVTTDSIENLNARNPFMIESIIFHREHIKYHFDENMVYCEDWWFWLTNFQGADFQLLKEKSSLVHITGRNTMSNVATLSYFELETRIRSISRFSSKSMKWFLLDLKLIIKYFLMSEQRLPKLWKSLPIVTLCGWILVHLPGVRQHLEQKIQHSKLMDLYQNE